MLILNGKVKQNFRVIKIIANNILTNDFKIIWQDIVHCHITNYKLLYNVKNNVCEICTTWYTQIGPKVKNSQNLLKFGTCNISRMPNSILISKTSFMKYLPLVKPKLFPKLKMLKIYWNMAHMKFVKYADFDYDAENDFHEIFTNC